MIFQNDLDQIVTYVVIIEVVNLISIVFLSN